MLARTPTGLHTLSTITDLKLASTLRTCSTITFSQAQFSLFLHEYAQNVQVETSYFHRLGEPQR